MVYSTSTRLGLRVYEYRGVSTRSPLDKTASNSGSSASPSTGTAATTTAANALVLAAFVLNSGETFSSWTNSFAEQNDFKNTGATASQSCYGGADRIVSTTGALGFSPNVRPSSAGADVASAVVR